MTIASLRPMQIKWWLLMAFACGKSSPAPKPVAVGAFTLAVPRGWEQTWSTTRSVEPGEVALMTTEGPQIYVFLTPMPEPLPRDPIDPATCKAELSDRLVTSAKVIDMPAGRACAVERFALVGTEEARISQRVLRAGEHGLLVDCMAKEHTEPCAAVFDQIRSK
jgi:hypothetical protein